MHRVPNTDEEEAIDLNSDGHLDEMKDGERPHRPISGPRKLCGRCCGGCSGRCNEQTSPGGVLGCVDDTHRLFASCACCLLRKNAQPAALCVLYLFILSTVLVYLIAQRTFDDAFNYYVEITSQLYAGPDVGTYRSYLDSLNGNTDIDVCGLSIQPLINPLSGAVLLVAPSGGGVVRSYVQQATRVSTSSVFCQHEFEYSGGFPGECLPEWWFQHVSMVYTPFSWLLPEMYPTFTPQKMLYIERNPLDSALENFSMRKARDHELFYFRAAGKIGRIVDFETEEWKLYFMNFIRDWVQQRKSYDGSLLVKKKVIFEVLHSSPINGTADIVRFLSSELHNRPDCIENGGPLDFASYRLPWDHSSIPSDLLTEACALTAPFWDELTWGHCT